MLSTSYNMPMIRPPIVQMQSPEPVGKTPTTATIADDRLVLILTQMLVI